MRNTVGSHRPFYSSIIYLINSSFFFHSLLFAEVDHPLLNNISACPLVSGKKVREIYIINVYYAVPTNILLYISSYVYVIIV